MGTTRKMAQHAVGVAAVAGALLLALATGALGQKHGPYAVRVNKCCEEYEVRINGRCDRVNSSLATPWLPTFTNGDTKAAVDVSEYYFAIGLPDCGSHQMFPVYDYYKSFDKLLLLPDGQLRHYILQHSQPGVEHDDQFHLRPHDDDDDLEDAAIRRHTYAAGRYCMDKAVSTTDQPANAFYAVVCSPERVVRWTDTDFLLRKIVNPICHGISMCILLVIAIVYFVLPTLRDLVGNIITTITLCLIVSQAANLVRIFTEFSSHVSFMVADIILYVSLLAAFFWLNSLGYYIWRTFRSRNVFLRVTDGRKYCWYSAFAWGATACMAGTAVFAHFFLDSKQSKKLFVVEDQETIGWLGIAIFFTPIACTILVDVFFYVTTVQVINRMNTYGRIHHKLKSNFVMFALMLVVMGIAWLFLVLSWLDLDGLLYAHIMLNAVQAPLLLYVCVLRQQNVKYLLKKSCCYNEPPSAGDWGDEMTYMNGGEY